MIGAEHGIGAFVLAAGNVLQTDQLFAGVLELGAMGLVISQTIGAAREHGRFLRRNAREKSRLYVCFAGSFADDRSYHAQRVRNAR